MRQLGFELVEARLAPPCRQAACHAGDAPADRVVLVARRRNHFGHPVNCFCGAAPKWHVVVNIFPRNSFQINVGFRNLLGTNRGHPCNNLDSEPVVEPLLCDCAGCDTAHRLPCRGPSAARGRVSAVLCVVSVVCVRRPWLLLHGAVIAWSCILVSDEETDRSAKRFPKLCARQDHDFIRFVPCSR